MKVMKFAEMALKELLIIVPACCVFIVLFCCVGICLFGRLKSLDSESLLEFSEEDLHLQSDPKGCLDIELHQCTSEAAKEHDGDDGSI